MDGVMLIRKSPYYAVTIAIRIFGGVPRKKKAYPVERGQMTTGCFRKQWVHLILLGKNILGPCNE